jgi:hypothetical protein
MNLLRQTVTNSQSDICNHRDNEYHLKHFKAHPISHLISLLSTRSPALLQSRVEKPFPSPPLPSHPLLGVAPPQRRRFFLPHKNTDGPSPNSIVGRDMVGLVWDGDDPVRWGNPLTCNLLSRTTAHSRLHNPKSPWRTTLDPG